MDQSQFTKDNWHRGVATVALRNAIRSRRWGMRVTVYNDGASSGDYILSYGLSNTNLQNNSNWLKVAEIGETWGGGGGSSTTKLAQTFNFTGGESVFTVTDGTLDQIDFVEINGAVQRPTTDFTVSGQDVTLTTPIPVATSGTLTVHFFEGLTLSPSYANGLEAANATGTAISFAIPQIYGSDAAPETGNITIVTGGLIKGMTQLLIHNNGSEPTYGSEIKIISGAYATGELNYIMLLAVSSTLVLVTISQEV